MQENKEKERKRNNAYSAVSLSLEELSGKLSFAI
jgi:hypothetical protein